MCSEDRKVIETLIIISKWNKRIDENKMTKEQLDLHEISSIFYITQAQISSHKAIKKPILSSVQFIASDWKNGVQSTSTVRERNRLEIEQCVIRDRFCRRLAVGDFDHHHHHHHQSSSKTICRAPFTDKRRTTVH